MSRHQWSEDLSPSEASAMMGSGGYERAAIATEREPLTREPKNNHRISIARPRGKAESHSVRRQELWESMPLLVERTTATAGLRMRLRVLQGRGFAKMVKVEETKRRGRNTFSELWHRA